MTVVKICGLMDLDSALAALEVGADLLGFVFAAGRRQLRPEDAASLVCECRGRFPVIQRLWQAVGVFANQPLEFVWQAAGEVGLDLVQLSGAEAAGYGRSLGVPFIRTFHMDCEGTGPAFCDDGSNSWGRRRSTRTSLAGILPTLPVEDFAAELRLYQAESGASRLLLDSGSPGRWGGTGETFAWDGVGGAAGECLVAGGLSPYNVSRAIATLHPWGVDVSSGVESAGRKDPELIRQFVMEVKRNEHHIS